MTYGIIIDTEGTSADPETAEVVQLAWREFGIAEPCRFNTYFGHRGPMDWGALAAHHILPEDLLGCAGPYDPSFTPRQYPFWIGHNIDFDWKCLGCPDVRRICTLAMARAIWPSLDSHRLSALIYYIKGPTPTVRELLRNAHDAAADVELCSIVFNRIWEDQEFDSLEHAYAFSEEARIPKFWGFGKFKGQPIEAADRGYANWYRKQTDTDPYVIQALRRAGLI